MSGFEGRLKWGKHRQVKPPSTIVLLSILIGALVNVLSGTMVEASPINILPSGKQLLLEAVQHAPATVPVSGQLSIHEVWHLQFKNFFWPIRSPLDTYWQRELQNSSVDLDLIANLRQERARIQFSILNQQGKQQGFVWLSHSQAIVNINHFSPEVPSDQRFTPKYPLYLISNPEQAPLVQSFWSSIEQTDPVLNAKTKALEQRLLTLVLEAIPDPSVRRVGISGVAIQFDEQAFESIVRSEIHTLYINHEGYETVLSDLGGFSEKALTRKLMHPFYSGEVHVEPTYWLFSRNLLTGKVTQSFEGGITFHQATGLWGTIRYHRLNFGLSPHQIRLPKITSANSETFLHYERSYSNTANQDFKKTQEK